ncbi:hypothetical protein T492DRAFT_992953 [Pavlovales sp. CCMP2436]|nr:hypothetical protein T492DRAFT_992953 [Pavlovales sp. CCMP2436]
MPWQALIVASAFVELIVAVVNADTKPTGYHPRQSGWNCIDFVLVLISILVAIAELAAYSAAPNVTLGLLSITRGFLARRPVRLARDPLL